MATENEHDRIRDLQREILASIRRIFLTNWAALTQVQEQMESLLRQLTEQRMESYRRWVKFLQWWHADFRRARAEFQKAADEVFALARRHIQRGARREGE